MPPVKSRAPARSARRPATGMKLGALAPASGRRAQRRPSQLSTQLAAFVLAGGAFILAAAWLGGSLNDTLRAANNGFDRFAIGSGFGVPQIEIKGLDVEEEALLRGALLFEDGEPIYRADPKTLRARALAQPFVADAAVYRLWPDRIEIHVKSRRAFARLIGMPHGARPAEWVIAPDGRPLRIAEPEDRRTLPLILGAGAEDSAGQLAEFLSGNSVLRREFSRAEYIGRRRWRLVLNDGTWVELPERDFTSALAKFESFHAKTPVLGLGFRRIDLRSPDKAYVLPSRPDARTAEQADERTALPNNPDAPVLAATADDDKGGA